MKRKKIFILLIVSAVICIFISSSAVKNNPYVSVFLTDMREEINIPIIMYHGLVEENAAESEYFLSIRTFENDLKWLKKNGFTSILPSQLADYVSLGTPLPQRPVIISFDDGYCNNYLLALPLLKKYSFKAVFSIIGSESDITSDDIYRDPSNCNMSWGEIALMEQSGLVEIADHTYNLHSNSGGRKGAGRKSGETTAEYEAALTEDLSKNRALIEKATGKPPITFAWPYGEYPRDGSGDPILKKLGYLVTFNSYQRTSTVTKGDASSLYGMGRYLRTPNFHMEKIIESLH